LYQVTTGLGAPSASHWRVCSCPSTTTLSLVVGLAIVGAEGTEITL